MNRIKKLITVFVLTLAITNIFAEGGKRTGTAGASELLIPVGPRGIAMGGSNLVSATGIEALFWNPAGVSHMKNNADILFSHMSYIADIGVEYGAVAANFEGFGAIAFSVKSIAMEISQLQQHLTRTAPVKFFHHTVIRKTGVDKKHRR